ncbi:MAG TPA: DUF3299 domain-containing protein [Rariglobus sp.]
MSLFRLPPFAPRLRFTLLAGCVLLVGMASSPARAGGAEEPRKVTFKVLASYPVDGAGAPPPAELQSLDGASVVVTGYMLPLAYAKGRTREFMLMRSQAACCFGLTPKANEFVVVTTDAEEGVRATQDVPSTFTGVFRIRPVKMGDAVVQCFQIEKARPL